VYHNHWDLEVIARDTQDRWLRDAERRRRLAAAGIGGRRGPLARLGALLAGVASKTHGAAVRPGSAPPLTPHPEPSTGNVARLDPSPEPARQMPRRAHPLTEPYAAMVVIARAPVNRPVDAPRPTRDC
jgi:hypothetical protein